MSAERWQRIEKLFHAALDRPAEDRERFLDAACAGDPALRVELDRLLLADARATGFEQDAAGHVQRIAGAACPPDHQVGAYRLLRELGRGGMGTVFLAERADAEFDLQVAIKLTTRGMDSDSVTRRFQHERQILAGLDHPNIARLLDGGTTSDGRPYFVMEYVDGQPIDEYCRTAGLPLGRRLHLFQQVCEAVEYAHRHLVVHRDLKPSNILVTSGGVPKLLDFGIAKVLETDAGDALLTDVGQAVMTPQYASPEQVRGTRVTTASDVYALGLLLYELLAGERPYELRGATPDAVARVVVEEDPEPPSARATRDGRPGTARQLRGDLDAIVVTALRKDPAERYASVGRLIDDLRRHTAGQPVVARGPSWAYRASRFVRRHRVGVAAAVAVGLALVAGVIGTAWQARVARAERAIAEQERARAERRFAEVRTLATSFLFDVHDAIARLPGATQARLLVVNTALEYLDRLAREASDDRALQEELAAAYDRVGDVQGNPGSANLGDTAGAVASYRKAAAIRRALAASRPERLEARLDLAVSSMRLASAEFARGDVKAAVGLFQEVLTIREEALRASIPEPRAARLAVADVTGRLCTTLVAVGDLAGALANCERTSAITDALLVETPADRSLRALRATSATGSGNALRLNAQPADAAVTLEDAIRRHRMLIDETPLDAELRRRLAVSYAYLANVHLAQQDTGAAAEAFGSAILELESLATLDPANARIRSELSYMLGQRVRILLKSGRRAEALADTRRSLALLRRAVEQPGASGDVFNEYAWALVSSEIPEARDAALGHTYARRALERAGSPNPVYLHTLAWAQYRLGRRDEAAVTLRTALGTLADASGPAVGLRRQLESDLARFASGQ